jgi:hypothetical protein
LWVSYLTQYFLKHRDSVKILKTTFSVSPRSFIKYFKTEETHPTLIKKIKVFLIFKEIQSGAVAKSYMRKGFLIYEEIRKYFPIYAEAVSHI